MKILVFDTCFNKTYIVYKDNDIIVDNKVILSTDTDYHSVFLIPEIRNILKNNNILFKDIDCIGVNIGPGSFTGIRAGVTVARVLAQQTNIKLVGVSSLEILAKLNNTQKNTIVTTDARKNKVYFAKYNNNGAIIEPMLLARELLFQNINSDDVVISDSSIGKLLEDNGIKYINYEKNDDEFGLFLLDITEKKLKACDFDYNWAAVKPLYIQPPSVSKPKEVKNV